MNQKSSPPQTDTVQSSIDREHSLMRELQLLRSMLFEKESKDKTSDPKNNPSFGQ